MTRLTFSRFWSHPSFSDCWLTGNRPKVENVIVFTSATCSLIYKSQSNLFQAANLPETQFTECLAMMATIPMRIPVSNSIASPFPCTPWSNLRLLFDSFFCFFWKQTSKLHCTYFGRDRHNDSGDTSMPLSCMSAGRRHATTSYVKQTFWWDRQKWKMWRLSAINKAVSFLVTFRCRTRFYVRSIHTLTQTDLLALYAHAA